jgi:hypothetical protein
VCWGAEMTKAYITIENMGNGLVKVMWDYCTFSKQYVIVKSKKEFIDLMNEIKDEVQK